MTMRADKASVQANEKIRKVAEERLRDVFVRAYGTQGDKIVDSSIAAMHVHVDADSYQASPHEREDEQKGG